MIYYINDDIAFYRLDDVRSIQRTIRIDPRRPRLDDERTTNKALYVITYRDGSKLDVGLKTGERIMEAMRKALGLDATAREGE